MSEPGGAPAGGDAGAVGELAGEVLGRLRAAAATLAVAESLTGGLVAATLTGVPGASAVFRGGVVAYATPLKAALLGVPVELLDSRGAVDPDVAVAMAEGVRARLGADYGVATTGVAGPAPQDGKPVGTVYVAVSAPPQAGGAGAGPVVAAHLFAGDRATIRAASVRAALDLLGSVLGR